MITNPKPYPAMKDSGVEWLGEVPEHWVPPRLGNLLMERGESNAKAASPFGEANAHFYIHQ